MRVAVVGSRNKKAAGGSRCRNNNIVVIYSTQNVRGVLVRYTEYNISWNV